MKWFRHDTDAHRNRKLRKVIRLHGLQGYGLWFLLLEKIYQVEGDFFVKADELWLEDLADELKLSDHRTLIRLLDTFSEVGLISTQLWEGEHVVFVESVVDRGDHYVEKRLYEREKKRKQREKTGMSSDVPTGQTGDKGTNGCMSPSDPDSYSDPDSDPDSKEIQEKKKKVKTASSFYLEFQEVYNTGKPEKWASIVVMNDKRKKLARQLATDCGGEVKAIEVLRGALRAASLDSWYPGKNLSLENFASNGKIIQLYERQVEKDGDLGTQISQEAIGAELTRLGRSGLLPSDWAKGTGCTTVSELPGKDAARYLAWLRQQEATHAA